MQQTEQKINRQGNAQLGSTARTANMRSEEVSERQRAYIRSLAQKVGLALDVTRINSRVFASRVIDGLLRMTQPGANGSAEDMRDRKVAFGLATKLVYQRHMGLYGNIRNKVEFWEEVNALYREYRLSQERVIALPSALLGASLPDVRTTTLKRQAQYSMAGDCDR